MKAQLQDAGRSGRKVLRCEGVGFAYGATPIVRDLTLTVMRGDRIGILGKNGSGKTTLLRLLLGELAPQHGEVIAGTKLEIAHYEQLHDVLDDTKTVFENVGEGRAVVNVGGGERHVVGYLQDFRFTSEQIQGAVTRLSGGERRRLQLAKILSRPCNLLVLDEPTNDLDLETLEHVEDLLMEFEGTVLLVSHDRVFLDEVVTSTLVAEGGGRWREYVGGYEDWLRQRPAAAPPAARRADAKPARPAAATPGRRAGYQERRELGELPKKIERLEAERQQLFERMAAPDFYRQPGAEIASAQQQLAGLDTAIAAAYARWQELESLTGAE